MPLVYLIKQDGFLNVVMEADIYRIVPYEPESQDGREDQQQDYCRKTGSGPYVILDVECQAGQSFFLQVFKHVIERSRRVSNAPSAEDTAQANHLDLRSTLDELPTECRSP